MLYSAGREIIMKKVNIIGKTVLLAAAFFVVTSIFGNGAAAQNKVVEKKEVVTKEIKKDNVGKKAGGKKKSKKEKRIQVVMGSAEKRKAALKDSFRKAGISQDDIDNIFADERIELYYNIYTPPVLKEGEQKKKKLSYFDEEFGLFKPESIESGKRIMADNKVLFEQIESYYGVPANYIVSIIRIETDFKKHLGKYRVFNALYTMSMLDKRPRRVAMARRELVAWVKMCKRRGMDPFAMKGSWAGAFGIPQFMPSSYVIFAVDYDGDGKADLYDYPDAFASIANYLHRVGWVTGNEKKMRRAVYNYNHEKAYVNAVFAYAERI
jgi:membrane-bound lytic murein transglycosylase B